MRLLLDINVLLEVAFKRPGENASAQVISRCGHEHEAWLAWHSVATLAYLIERQQPAVDARTFLRGVLQWADIAVTAKSGAQQALDLPMPDFEDALQAAAAVECGAHVILTHNLKDFKGSPVRAMTPEEFIRQHITAPVRPRKRASK
jgi:predicted nucleic acid-binding protein